MLYVISCTDKPEHGHVRRENHPAHLDYLKGLFDASLCLGLAPPNSEDSHVGEPERGVVERLKLLLEVRL